jgi:hypothetical protein
MTAAILHALAAVAAALVFLASGSPISAQTKQTANNPLTYLRTIYVRAATYRNGAWCIDFSDLVKSADFFDGLERKDSPEGPAFYKGSTRITQFPDEITIYVVAQTRDCKAEWSFPWPPVITDQETKFMNALHFQTKWKRGMDERPADSSFTVRGPESVIWPEYDPPSWNFTLNLKSRGVPLTDQLVIEIYARDRRAIVRFAVHL